MGADFTYAVCEWPFDATGYSLQNGTELAEKVCERFSEMFVERWERLEEFGVWVEQTGDEKEDAEARQTVLNELLEQVRSVFGGGWVRDVAPLNLSGKEYVITGGMSWGDDPTDSYQIISILCDWGVTREPF